MTSKNKKTDQGKIESELRKLGAKLDEMIAKAEQAKGEAKEKYQKQVEILRPKLETAQKKMEELKKTGDTAWKDVKSGLGKAWDELKIASKKAASRFK